jgi:hypothetical protein
MSSFSFSFAGFDIDHAKLGYNMGFMTEKGLDRGALGWTAVLARDQEIMTELHTSVEKFDRALLFGCFKYVQ